MLRLGLRSPRVRPIAGILLLACLSALLIACSDGAAPTQAPEPVAAAVTRPPSPVAAPSTTPSASGTPGVAPSPSAAPTQTPIPSQLPSDTPVPAASATPAPPSSTATATATATATSTATPAPTPTSAPTATPAPTMPVYDAAYVADVTIPDGTVIEPGVPFTKTWRLRNTGDAPWEEGVALVLAAGEAMGAPEAVPVPATAPGETTDVSVPMVAPKEIGSHSAAWRLCRDGACFGGAVMLQIVSRAALAVAGPGVELSAPAEGGECNYIGNRNPSSMKFHRADCRWVREMNEANKVCFATREEAISRGFVPCKVCGP